MGYDRSGSGGSASREVREGGVEDMAARKAGLIWQDAQGERCLHVITTAAGVGAIESALTAQSNADVIECWEGLDETYTIVPSTSAYPTVRVVAVLMFVDGTGSSGKLYLPAPDAAVFMPDGDTVDPSAVAGIITAAIGSLLSGAGNPVTAFVGGTVLRTKLSGLVTSQ